VKPVNESSGGVENWRYIRTLSIVRDMIDGKVLVLGDGSRIGMADDMTIGYLMRNAETGEEVITAGIPASMTLADLNRILDRWKIGFAIPRGR